MRHVLITGASKGLGKAIWNRIAKDSDCELSDISRTSGYDLSTETGIVDAMVELQRISPNILILNAGVWQGEVLKLNFQAPLLLADLVDKSVLVIFILSNAAYRNYSNDEYTTAKSGLLHYARRKQAEGYQFATISPGTIDGTNFWDHAEIDNRKAGAIPVKTVAEIVYQIIKAWENGALVTELIIMPKK